MAAFFGKAQNLTGAGEPVRIQTARVSGNFFDRLGVQAQSGRGFRPEEDAPGGGDTVVLSHGLWQRRFGGATDAVGKTITLDRRTCTIVGVAPAGFAYPDAPDLWAPAAFSIEESHNRGARYLSVVARLKPGVAAARANTEMVSLAQRRKTENPGDQAGWSARVVPLRDDLVGSARVSLWVLLAAVGTVLLVACANIANLLLIRGLTRGRELAIRAALGATSGRIGRQLLAEAAVLAVAGAGVGLCLARWGVQLLAKVTAGNLPRAGEAVLDWRVFGFGIVAAILTTILVGLLPALQLARPALTKALNDAARGSTTSHAWWRGALVVTEVGLALVLLVTAGLLLRSLVKLRAVDTGMQIARVLTLRISLPEARYREKHQQAAFFEEVVHRLAALPSVQAAGAAPTLPLTGGLNSYSFDIDGRSPGPEENFSAEHDSVTPDFFRALGMRLAQGRLFGGQDGADAPQVVLINETAARRFFPNVNPLGRRVRIAGPEYGEIVGVVADVKQYGLESAAPPHMYSPLAQKPMDEAVVYLRTTGNPSTLASAVRATVLAVDPEQPVSDVQPLDEVWADSFAARRVTMWLLGLFAAMALGLAMLGLYGVMAFHVSRRTREIGVRLALGASPGRVMRLVLLQGGKLVILGLALGVMTALAGTRFLASQLYGVGSTDAVTYAITIAILSLAALVAILLPAFRAAWMDPLVALRQE